MFSVTASKHIQAFCHPLRSVSCINFMHDITFSNGQISMIMRNKEILLDLYRNKTPTLCTDASGRTLSDGVYINKALESTRYDCALLMPRFVQTARKYGENYGKKSLHIVTREKDCQHFYCLFFDLNEYDFLQWIINNGNFISDLIANYKVKSHDIILEAKAPENRIVLPTAKDAFLYLAIKDNKKNDKLTQVFHKHLKMPVHLTRRQSDCLVLLAEGKTAKEIAGILGISHRTVEDYFETIRKQLGCSSNKKLIAEYGEQIQITKDTA